LNIKIALLF